MQILFVLNEWFTIFMNKFIVTPVAGGGGGGTKPVCRGVKLRDYYALPLVMDVVTACYTDLICALCDANTLRSSPPAPVDFETQIKNEKFFVLVWISVCFSGQKI
jgi:hypothetical protein